MPPTPFPSNDDYLSSEDSEFAPEDKSRTKDDETSSDEDSESEETAGIASTNKRKHPSDSKVEDLDIDNSGDEAVVLQTKRKKKSSKEEKKGLDAQDDAKGTGFVKTRSQRAQERKELHKPEAVETSATIDVDAVWQAMISGQPLSSLSCKLDPKSNLSSSKASISSDKFEESEDSEKIQKDSCTDSQNPDEGPDSMIKIKRTYKFAGKVYNEEKLIARDSAEAKLHCNSSSNYSSSEATESVSSDQATVLKRPPKLARRSIFEPVSENLLRRSDLHFGTRKQALLGLASEPSQEKKLNTVEKSAMDWASFVDKEGIADELDAAGKSKGAYKARQEFLARVEQKIEDKSRRVRGLPV